MVLVQIKHALFGPPSRRSSTSTTSEDTFADPERQPLITSSPKLLSAASRNNRDGEDDAFSSSSGSSQSSWDFKIDARVISDATIGLSDGLTVPFALTAGLSALGKTDVVIYGGLAELIAGAISMGLGGYLGAKSEAASYRETRRECAEQAQQGDKETMSASVRSVFASYDLPAPLLADLARHLAATPDRYEDFLMRFAHCEPEPAANRAAVSALTIAAGYLFGGLVPLLPYFFVSGDRVDLALWVSVAVMAVALFVFGYAKTCAVCGWRGRDKVGQGVVGGLEMVVVGGAAAAAAMGLVKLFDGMANGGSGGA